MVANFRRALVRGTGFAAAYWTLAGLLDGMLTPQPGLVASLLGQVPPESLQQRLGGTALLALFGLATSVRGCGAAALVFNQKRRECACDWQEAFDAVRDVIFMHDADGRIVDANQAYAEHAGLPLDRLRGRPYWQVFPRSDGPLPGCSQVLETHEGESSQDEIELPDGRFFQSRAFVVRDGNGDYRYSIHILEDVSEQRRAERALRDQQRQLSAIFEAARNVSFIITDLNGSDARVLEFSPGAEQLFGYRRDEMLGQPVARLHMPEDVERFPEALAAMAERRDGFSGETTLVRRGGERFPALFTSYPLFDENDQMVAALGISLDITKRKRIEEELRRHKEQLEAVFANMQVLTAVLDADFRFLRVNVAYAEMAGIPAEALIGRNHFDLYPDADNERIFREVVESGRPHSEFSKPFRDPQRPQLGTTYWDWTLVPLKAETGEVEGLVLSLVDVTERAQAADALLRAHDEMERRVYERTARLRAVNQELEAFSYSISHDLRAPLRAINGFAAILQEDFPAGIPAEAHNHLDRIQASTRRMAALIDDLLLLSRVARTELHPEPVDLAAVARDVIHELEHAEPDRQVSFTCPEHLVAEADPALIRSVLENLLGNAWKFTRNTADARIEFGRTEADSHPEFFVRDNGAGFDMCFGDKLFQAFQRLHTDSEYPGTGIGLATVARIIRAHGGQTRAEGSEGAGATFYFTLNVGSGDPA